MRGIVVLLLCTMGFSASAEILVPSRTIRAKEIIQPEDLVVKAVDVAGAISEEGAIVGQEARVALYPGRPIRHSDVGPPAIVDRNDVVPLIFSRGGLLIITEGRAMGRGASGEVIRVMNLTSRTTVTGRIRSDGSIEVH